MVCHFSIHHSPANFYIQTVTVEITANLVKRGSMSAYLISPGGTVSCLLEGRPYDTTRNNYKKLRLRSYHFIGENLLGQWTIKIFTYKEQSKPTFDPLYAFKTGSQSTSPPPISPVPLNSDGNTNNPVPTDSALPSSVNSDAVPSVTTQPLPVSPNSQVVKDPNPQPAPPPVSSTQGQQSQSTTDQATLHSQNSIISHPQPASPALASISQKQKPRETNPHFHEPPPTDPSNPVDKATPDHAGSPNTAVNLQDSKSTLGSGDRSASGTLATSNKVDSKHSAAPANGPAPNSSSKPPRAASTNVPPSRSSPRKQNGPNAKNSRERTVNEVGQISFRFLLVENLPLELKIVSKRKSDKRRDFDLELMKIWVDFRQYLLVQTDPENYGTKHTINLKDVYGITNVFIQKLLTIQDDANINSLASISVDHLRSLTLTDNSPHHPPVQYSDLLAGEGVHPHVLPNQKLQNGDVPPEKQEHQHGPPSSGAQQSR